MKAFQSLLFSVYPIIFLTSRYPDEANNFMLYFLCSIFFGLAVIGCHYYFFEKKLKSRDLAIHQTIVISYVILFLFFSFGHAFNQLYQDLFDIQLKRDMEVSDKDLILLTQSLMIFFWFVLLMSTYKAIGFIKLDKLKTINSVLFIFSVSLVSIPLFSISKYVLFKKEIIEDKSWVQLPQYSPDCMYCDRDVYYIIMDGYPRNDILEEFYNFNNDEFTGALQSLGFDIVEEAKANYFWTNLALASALNMNYLDTLNIELGKQGRDMSEITPFIRNNLVSQIFRSIGYQYIHMDSTWDPTRENPYADIEYACDTETLRNDFHKVFVEGTMLRVLNNSISDGLAQCHLNNYKWLTETAPDISGKKFVFAHFVAPHPPYLFDSAGNIQKFVTISDQFGIQTDIWGNRKAYLEQLKFVNKKILTATDNIIKKSKKQPIIIIQSDHGPHLDTEDNLTDKKNHTRGRASIFLAILTPDNRQDIPVKTSVNVFRYILTNYFDINFEEIDNKYFKSSFRNPLILKEIE